ncbi:MAG: TrkH family potassium uptake protein [bacterium]|jgi:trk system potassium uptake protein TrkH|nr:TrkH family potassium uptake protein [bacterium]MDD4152690.1 TrkH family potassium uptake protein [bacterium]MDD4557842.1 TrkH family potassium uptake protein [bacterium]
MSVIAGINKKSSLTPPQVMVLGFLLVIIIGAFLLSLPGMIQAGKHLSPLDAFFTSNSAVCVTGLVVTDTGTTFTFLGQLVVLALIQIGGLGFMTMSTIIFALLRRRIGLRERLLIRESLGQISLQGMVKLVKYVVRVTFIIEGTGALLLLTRWGPLYGFKRGLFLSIFHAVSAFCNAGFDILGPYTGPFTNLTAFVGDPLVNIVICSLIISGGIGFMVIADLYDTQRHHHPRLLLHTKIVLITTVVLIVVGTLAIFLLEYGNPATLGKLSLPQKIWASFFQAVTPRTAGFNTISIGDMSGATLLLIVILMFIGASPGGTGGGIKTTTFALLLISAGSVISAGEEINISGRRIPFDLALRALAITLLALFLVVIATMSLVIIEDKEFMSILFEVVSAFGTVGLSTGITPKLSIVGKMIIPFVMFVGRVGPLTLATALAQRRRGMPVSYPEERISIG